MPRVLATFKTTDEQGVFEDTIMETDKRLDVQVNPDMIIVRPEVAPLTEEQDMLPFAVIPSHSLLYLLVDDDVPSTS